MADDVLLPAVGDGTTDVTTRTKDRATVHTPIVALDINPAGSEVLGTGDATNGMDVDVTRVQESLSAPATDTWDDTTPGDTVLVFDCSVYPSIVLQITSDGGSCSGGLAQVEGSSDGGSTYDANWAFQHDAGAGEERAYLLDFTQDFNSFATTRNLRYNTGGFTHVQVRLDTVLTGTITLDLRLIGSTVPSGPFGIYASAVIPVSGDADGAVPEINPVGIAGTDGSLMRRIKTDASGELQVDVLTLPNVVVSTLPALVAGTANIGDVDVLTLPALPAGSNNIGDVDVLTLPNVTIGTMAPLVAGTANIGDVDVLTLPALPAGNNNIGDVDVASLPALVAGTANIGDVDVLTVPADPFGVNADAASATGSISAKLRFIAATGIPVTALPAIPAGNNNIGDVDVASLPALVAGTANIGDVDVLTVPAPLNIVGPGSNATALRVAMGYPANAYYYNIVSQVHVASANTVHWDLFNADAALIVRVVSIKQIPNVTTAVTGIVFDWLLERTTAVGTGGSTVTAWLADLNDTALDADITCRSKPTGGATQSTDLVNYSISSEETNAATIMLASLGGLELVPEPLRREWGGKGIVLRQNQGLRCVQITNSNAGNTAWLIGFTVE